MRSARISNRAAEQIRRDNDAGLSAGVFFVAEGSAAPRGGGLLMRRAILYQGFGLFFSRRRSAT
jgi:hypothetical protein